MKNSSNVISLIDRHQNCDDCRLSAGCLVPRSGDEVDDRRARMQISGHVVRRGTHIYRMGEPFDSLYSVRSGAVKTYRLTADGDQQVTGFYLPGDVFGLDSIGMDAYPSNAVALDTSCICRFSYDQLRTLCARSTETNDRLTGRLSSRIRDAERVFMVLGHKSVDERIAWFLLDLSNKQVRLGLSANELHLVMPRTDISSYLMLAVETVSRVLTRLQNSGIISVNRNRITIEAPAELASIAGFEPGDAENSPTGATDGLREARG